MKQVYHSIKYSAAGLLCMFMLVSCGDFLDVTPRDIVTEDNFWDEKTDVDQMVAGCYTAMQAQTFVDKLIVWGDLRGDDVDGASGISGHRDLHQALINNLLPTNGYTDWAPFYYVIDKCNTIIRMAPVVNEKDPAYRVSDMQATIAEATALRSLCYWYLIRAFDKVPFYRDAIQQEDEVQYPAPMEFNAVLNELIADLEEVKGNAIERYATTDNDQMGASIYSNCNRITRNAIRAMLCDMYLWRGDYSKVIENVNEILASKEKEYNDMTSRSALKAFKGYYGTTVYLYPNNVNSSTGLNNSFNAIFGTGNSYESLFELAFNYAGQGSPYLMNTALGRLYGAGITKEIDGLAVNNGVGLLRPVTTIISEGSKGTSSVWNIFRNYRDVRFFCSMRSVDKEYGEGIVRKGVASIFNTYLSDSKIVNYEASAFGLPVNMNRNWIFYRLTDVLLMGAEAYVMMSSDEDTEADQENLKMAFDYLDIVNQRSVVLESMQLHRSPITKRADLKAQVRRERRLELMFEGKRWFDLIRYCNQDNSLDIANSIPPKCGSVGSSRPFPTRDFLFWPYNRNEVKRNPNLNQKGIYDKESDSFELNK